MSATNIRAAQRIEELRTLQNVARVTVVAEFLGMTLVIVVPKSDVLIPNGNGWAQPGEPFLMGIPEPAQ